MQGNKVSLRQSSIIKDAPNQCSSNNDLFMYLKAIIAATLPCGCSAALRSLSHFFLLLPAFGQLLCPVCHFIHFVLRFAPLHPFAAKHFALRHGTLTHTPTRSNSDAHAVGKAYPTILTGFHYATQRTAFISIAYSPPAAFCSCARLAAPGLRSGASLAQNLRL